MHGIMHIHSNAFWWILWCSGTSNTLMQWDTNLGHFHRLKCDPGPPILRLDFGDWSWPWLNIEAQCLAENDWIDLRSGWLDFMMGRFGAELAGCSLSIGKDLAWNWKGWQWPKVEELWDKRQGSGLLIRGIWQGAEDLSASRYSQFTFDRSGLHCTSHNGVMNRILGRPSLAQYPTWPCVWKGKLHCALTAYPKYPSWWPPRPSDGLYIK